MERLERYKRQVSEQDKKRLLQQFNERLSKQSQHNDIPNV